MPHTARNWEITLGTAPDEMPATLNPDTADADGNKRFALTNHSFKKKSVTILTNGFTPMQFSTCSVYVPLVAILLLLSAGCSTISHIDSPSGLEIKSSHSGAAILIDGVPCGRTGSAPVRIAVAGDSGQHVVRLEKDGCVPQEFMVEKSMSDWVWGNAAMAPFPLVAAAGVGIDSICGKWYRLDPPELSVKLETFESE